MARWIPVAIVAAASLASEARADSWKRDVDLVWEKSRDTRADAVSLMAKVPNAKLLWVRSSDGGRYIAITYSDGNFCQDAATGNYADRIVSASCGGDNGYYMMRLVPGSEPALSWHTNNPASPVGSK
jgi:hypothetical protein